MIKIMKKRNIILVSLILGIAAVSFIILLISKKTSKALYIYDYENYSQGHHRHGYIIYDDGAIGEYEKYVHIKDKDKRPKRKITNEELKKLKKLADEVNDNYMGEETFVGTDRGQSTSKIYNSNLNKWVILGEGGSYLKINKSETAKAIEEYTRMLKDKYLNNEH